MAFKFSISILLAIAGLACGNADTEDLYSVASIERQAQQKTITWTKQSTCGKIDYKTGIYKKWDLQDSNRPSSVGKCSGACRMEGFSKCKSFIYYYKKKNCMLLNYEVDKTKFLEHVSAACGYWVDPPTAIPTATPTPFETEPSVDPPTTSPTESPACKAVIQMKFANKPDQVGTFGQHNDYLLVTKTSKNKDFDYQPCCYNQVSQWWGCEHDGGDAVFENFEDEYYDYIDTEKVVINNARGSKYLVEAKHYFNDFEAAYYGNGYADHTVPAKVTIFVNGVAIKKFAHAKNKGKNTHIYEEGEDPKINPEYIGYIKARLRCDKECDCHVNVYRNYTLPNRGPCDRFD